MDTLGPDPLFLSLQLALAGRYSIARELGRGGMGIVYLAREVHLDRLVAIKLLPPQRASDPSLRERFLREARVAARLSHPNIIPIHAVEESDAFVFYVMAYVDGETLAHRVRTRGPLPTSEGTRVMREVAWALAHAHSQGLVHRDVKPDNVLLEADTGRVLVADFGIAAALADLARDGVVGTPEFMSPEQALGKEIDARSDLYGLGATAFYAFSGRLPFEGKSTTEILAKHVTQAAPSLASMGMPVSRKVAQIVDRCLAKDPEHRPANADTLAEQLGMALEQRRELPVALRAFVKHNGRPNGGGTVIFLGSLAGAAGTGWYTGAWGWIPSIAMVLAGMTVPFAYLVQAARRLSLQGFTAADVGPAFASEIEKAREEHAVEHRRDRRGVEQWLKWTAAVSTTVVFGTMAAMGILLDLNLVRASLPLLRFVDRLVAIAGPIALPTAVGYLALLQRRRDVDTEFWGKVWTGRIGKLAFSIARKLLRGRAISAAVTHRATELSLGMAAESLFESLPAATRKSLGDVPAVARRLQDDAQNLRKLYDQLQEALTAATDGELLDAYAGLRADCDAVHAKLGEAVGALETIRLNLLRLHAGSGSVEGLTTHIALAADVSGEIERLLAAQQEMEHGLAFPRETAATPV